VWCRANALRDLVIRVRARVFESRPAHDLKGVPASWHLLPPSWADSPKFPRTRKALAAPIQRSVGSQLLKTQYTWLFEACVARPAGAHRCDPMFANRKAGFIAARPHDRSRSRQP